MHASLRFFWVFSYSISHPFYSMDVLGQQVDAFIASPGCLKDIAPFVASEELSQSFFARYNLYAPPMAVQAAGGAGATSVPSWLVSWSGSLEASAEQRTSRSRCECLAERSWI